MVRRNTWAAYEHEADWVIGLMASNTAAEPASRCPSSVKFCFCPVEIKSIKQG